MKNRLDLSHFSILQEFKGNSCNKIYLVTRPGETRKFIFKVIKIYNFQSQLREIQAQKNLKHNYIIRLLDYEIQKESIVLLIEYAEKGDLFEFINTIESIRESKLLRLFYKIVVAVHFIHLNGFIHRDIKPENILIGGDNEPKLADFGSSVSEEIVRNTFCGTYEYMAPEIYMRRKQTAKVDSWALGVLLFEMTHNNTPFKNKDVMEIREIVESDRIQFDEQISMKIRNIIRQILKFDAKERPTTAQILKFPELKRFYLEMKPDLLSMYQDNKIAKIRKIKSMNNGFKVESQYRHMQTTTNLPESKPTSADSSNKKASNDLKRYSQDLTDSLLKNQLRVKKTEKQKLPEKRFEKKKNPVFAETSIGNIQKGSKSGLDMRGNSQPKKGLEAFRVSIHSEQNQQGNTSFEKIQEILKGEAPLLNESDLFKQQFLTSQYEKSTPKSRSKLTSSSSKKPKKDKKKDVEESSKNGSSFVTNFLSNVKLDMGSKAQKLQQRSISKKIRALFEKPTQKAKKPKVNGGMFKMNTDSNYQSAMFLKQSKSKQNIAQKYGKKAPGIGQLLQNYSSQLYPKSKDPTTPTKPKARGTRKKKFKVDSKHFKDFEKKFALKLGMAKHGSQREEPKHMYSKRDSGAGASMVERESNRNHVPDSKRRGLPQCSLEVSAQPNFDSGVSYSKNLYTKFKSNFRSNHNFSGLSSKYSLNRKLAQKFGAKPSSSRQVPSALTYSRGKSLVSKFNSQKSSTKHSEKSKHISIKTGKKQEDKDSTNDPGSKKHSQKKRAEKYPVSFSALRKNYSLAREGKPEHRGGKFRMHKGLSTEELFRADADEGYFSNQFY